MKVMSCRFVSKRFIRGSCLILGGIGCAGAVYSSVGFVNDVIHYPYYSLFFFRMVFALSCLVAHISLIRFPSLFERTREKFTQDQPPEAKPKGIKTLYYLLYFLLRVIVFLFFFFSCMAVLSAISFYRAYEYPRVQPLKHTLGFIYLVANCPAFYALYQTLALLRKNQPCVDCAE